MARDIDQIIERLKSEIAEFRSLSCRSRILEQMMTVYGSSRFLAEPRRFR